MNRREIIKGFLALAVAPFVPSLVRAAVPMRQNKQLTPFPRWTEIRFNLPAGVCFYDVAGQIWFPVYGRSGGLTTEIMCKLWKGRDGIFMTKDVRLSTLSEVTADPREVTARVKQIVESAAMELYYS